MRVLRRRGPERKQSKRRERSAVNLRLWDLKGFVANVVNLLTVSNLEGKEVNPSALPFLHDYVEHDLRSR